MSWSCREQHRIQLRAIDRLDLDQVLGNGNQLLFLLAQNGERGLVSLIDQCRNLSVDLRGGRGADRRAPVRVRFDGNIAERGHAEFADHATSNIGNILEVLAGPGRDIAEDNFLSGAPTHSTGHLRQQLRATHQVAIFSGCLDSDTQGHTARDSRDLLHRIGTRDGAHNDSVSNLVIRDDRLLSVGNQAALALGTRHDAQNGLIELRLADHALPIARRQQRGLVQQAGKVSAGETSGLAGQVVQFYILGERLILGMHLQNLQATTDVGLVQHDAAIETTRTQQRLIEHIGTIGRGYDHDVRLLIKTIHLDEELVQRLLALVIAARTGIATLATNGVNLINEENAGGVLFRFLEQVAHAGSAYAHKHLHKLGATDAIECHVRLTRDGTRDQCLASAGRADQQDAFGSTRPHGGKAIGIFQKFDNLLQFHLGLFDTGHILKKHRGARFVKTLRLRAREGHGLPAESAASDQEIGAADDKQNQHQVQDSLRPLALLPVIDIYYHAIVPKYLCYRLPILFRRVILLSVCTRRQYVVSAQRHRFKLVLIRHVQHSTDWPLLSNGCTPGNSDQAHRREREERDTQYHKYSGDTIASKQAFFLRLLLRGTLRVRLPGFLVIFWGHFHAYRQTLSIFQFYVLRCQRSILRHCVSLCSIASL